MLSDAEGMMLRRVLDDGCWGVLMRHWLILTRCLVMLVETW